MKVHLDQIRDDFWSLFAFLITEKPVQTPPPAENFDEWSIDYDYLDTEQAREVYIEDTDCHESYCDFDDFDVCC